MRSLIDSLDLATIDDEFRGPVEDAFDRVIRATDHVVAHANQDPELPGAVSTDYLDLLGYTLYGWLWARMARVAVENGIKNTKHECARFYFARLLPKIFGLEASILSSSDVVMNLADEDF